MRQLLVAVDPHSPARTRSAVEQAVRIWREEFVGIRLVRVQPRLNPVRQQQAVRWNLYQIAQASWRAEGAGVPAKGLTGQAYEGHYFWDTEVYVLPFLSYTQPRIARNLLQFRHSMLGRARDRAAEMSQQGALFPWRTAQANVEFGLEELGLAPAERRERSARSAGRCSWTSAESPGRRSPRTRTSRWPLAERAGASSTRRTRAPGPRRPRRSAGSGASACAGPWAAAR